MEAKKESIRGYWVLYEEEEQEGFLYLRDRLQEKESKTLFDAARQFGDAAFQDSYYSHHWSLVYNHGDSTYTLVKR